MEMESEAIELAALAEREVIEFHDGIALWAARGDAAARDRLLDHLHPEMQMVDIDGGIVSPERLRAGLGEGGGEVPDFEVAIADFELVWSAPAAVLVTFAEHQSFAGRQVERRMTALLLRDPAARSRLLWRHVHETTIASVDGAA